MAPGKTAPRLLQDLFTYDPRYEEGAGRNLLTSPPPPHNSKAPPVAAVPSRNCRHNLFTKSEQSLLPVAGQEPSPNTVHKVASYCVKCRWHVDVLVDHRTDAAKVQSCGKGNEDYALHHFLYHGEDGATGTARLEPQLRPRTYIFRCSAPECAVRLRVSMKPPCFSEQDIDTLTNQAQLRRRWEAAKQTAGDRADASMARRVDAPDYLNTYLQDSLKPAKGKARIPLLNKKFLKTFGQDCDSILRRLGFEKHREEEDDTVVEAWYLPKPEEAASPLETTLRTKIEDARYELNTIILDMPESERVGCRHQPMYPTPSRGDMERALACADYAKVKGRETRSTNHEEDHPYYASLGAVGDFDDALILFAFSRQGAVDIENKAYYFECLQDLATGRQSDMLEMQVAMLASQGLTSKREAERAYQYFGIDPTHASVIGDDHIIGCFRSRLADVSVIQAEEARKQLRVLGDVRESEKIRAEASGSIETYEQAMAFFDLDPGVADDFVPTMYSLKTQDNPSSIETARRAVEIIAEARKSERLHHFAKFGTMSDPEMDVGDAYALFDQTDRTVPLDPAVLESVLSTYEIGTSERLRMEKAHALIQYDQSQRFGDNHVNPNRSEVRRNLYPLNTWPVGLRNIGNTCYLNSVLQFLFTIKPLRNLILDIEKHMQDPSPEALKNKKVGRMLVTAERVLTAQKFVRELRALFEQMTTASTETVQPAIDLASLALCKSDNPVESVQSPLKDTTDDVGLGTIDGAAVSGPVLPPAAMQSALAEVPAGSVMTGEETKSADSIMENGDVNPITPADAVMADDGLTSKGESGIPAPPTRPPPIPPRSDPKPAVKPAVQPSTKIGRIEESARQQDAAEVMANIFDLVSCAITGDNILREGEQGDAIKKLFFGDVTTVMEKPDGVQKVQELRDHFLVATGQRDRSLYATLDEDFGLGEIEGGGGTRYDYVEQAAPIQIINVKRLQFNKGQPVYDHSHIGLEKTMYLDRYLARTPTLDEAQLLELRKAQWAKQKELRELDAKRTKLQTTGMEGMNLPDCLEATSEFVYSLAAEKPEHEQSLSSSQDLLPTPPPELSDALHSRAANLAADLSGIDGQMATLESEINTVFKDCTSVPYRLHAIFTHRGDVKGGHYWIYIYDFQNNDWRVYNDERVDPVVEESMVLDKEEGTRPKVSTGVVYVRADLVDEYTEAVCRRPEKSDEDVQTDVEMKDAAFADANDEIPALEPVDLRDVPVIEGVEKE
ncbi:ubiquitin carboxyl-terminal hydrolase 25 [Alternaria panax]|uniref:ubiquitinyl hydrolase 1 n=1 Tax=Alternaria panax TaxID=48097 RepID=A0AAD4ID68_9PLEO|nr:ubiquitin carboxyl-terminal hydrolase 25 [Alternaria panax]